MNKKLRIRKVDREIRLIPYYDNFEETIKWYQDVNLVKQVDNHDKPYSMDLLKSMYHYLRDNGDLYYIEYLGNLVGDVTLENNGEVAIVVSTNYQNKHIGRRVIKKIIKLAKKKKMNKISANIYSFNSQSIKMFLSCGFKKIEDEWYEYIIKE